MHEKHVVTFLIHVFCTNPKSLSLSSAAVILESVNICTSMHCCLNHDLSCVCVSIVQMLVYKKIEYQEVKDKSSVKIYFNGPTKYITNENNIYVYFLYTYTK